MVRLDVILLLLAHGIALAGFLPLFPHLAWGARFLFFLAAIAGLAFDLKGQSPLRGWLLTLISIVLFLFFASRFTLDNVAQPAASMLVLFLAVRLVGEKSPRHHLQLAALALFALATSSLFDLSALFLAYLALLIILISLDLVLLTFQAADPALRLTGRSLRSICGAAIIMPLVALPLMAIFFFILPRSQFPLWQFLAKEQAVTGITDEMALGKASSINESPAVAFRVECAEIPPQYLYWRTVVLHEAAMDGWRRLATTPNEVAYPYRGKEVRQVIYPEPGLGKYLPLLNVPRLIRAFRVSQGADYVFTSPWIEGKRVKYEASSTYGEALRVRGEIDRSAYLQLPADYPASMARLARQIGRRGKNDAERLQQLQLFYEQGGYRYGVQGLPVGKKAVEEFLFAKKIGHCEFFASSFALLLRGAGVPCRLVGGYQGGIYNQLGGYYVVTEARAHVWVEVYLSGSGWVTVDPSRLATNFTSTRESIPPRDITWRLRLLLDSLGYFWNQAVVNYDLSQQVDILRRAGHGLQGMRFSRRGVMRVALPVGVIITLLLLVLNRDRFHRGTEERLMGAFLKALRRRFPTLLVTPATGLFELAARIGDPVISEFVALYGASYYRGEPLSSETLLELRLLLKKIKAHPQKGSGPLSTV